MTSRLPKYESRLYFFIWTSAVCYSIYKVTLTNSYFINYNDVYSDFESGWFWIKRRKDSSDQEWAVWIPFLWKLTPWLTLHHLISRLIKLTANKRLLCLWYTSMSTFFLCNIFGILSTLYILIQILMLYLVTNMRSRMWIWIAHMILLLIINISKTPNGFFQKIMNYNDDEHYLFILTICWIFLRSISYDIDAITAHAEGSNNDTLHRFGKNMLNKFTYCLYLPTLTLGPLILYHDFQSSINSDFQVWNTKRLIQFALNLCRYIFWMYFTELSLHFVYVNAIQYHPQLVQGLNPWALYGLGYCMGQFFLNKYVVIYGINSTLCTIDDIKAPPQPKCIGRIHLYSDMWKYFDRGLYVFLVRYIYAPVQAKGLNKLFASLLCFAFIFLWHGLQVSILMWAFFNFLGLTIEGAAKSIGKSKAYYKIQNEYLTYPNARRFTCMLASPLLAMSAVSNFYFFAGREIGDIYVMRTLRESWTTLLSLLFFLYCCCQVSVDIKNWESQQDSNQLKRVH